MTGIIANPNLDEKNQKAQRLRDLEDHFSYAMDVISGQEVHEEREFKEDPFYAAMNIPAGEIETPTAEEVEELEKQQEEHEEIMEGLDQG